MELSKKQVTMKAGIGPWTLRLCINEGRSEFSACVYQFALISEQSEMELWPL